MKELFIDKSKKTIFYVIVSIPVFFFSAYVIGYTAHFVYDFATKIIGLF